MLVRWHLIYMSLAAASWCRRISVPWFSHHIFPSGTLAIPVQRLFLCRRVPLSLVVWMCSSCGYEAVTWRRLSLPSIWIVWVPTSTKPELLHGKLLQRSGSCSHDSGSSLNSLFHIRPVLTVSRSLGGRSPHRGFLSLIRLSEIQRHRQFRFWVDFPRLWLGSLCLLHFMPLLRFWLGQLSLVEFIS